MTTTSSETETAPSSWLEQLWRSVQERAKTHGRVFDKNAQAMDRAQVLCVALLSERGEASGAVVASELYRSLAQLNAEQRHEWFRYVAGGFLPDKEALQKAAQQYQQNPTAETTAKLTKAAEPPRQELLRRLNMAPGATAMLVNMRKELRHYLREEKTLWPLEYDLHHLLSSWFNRGFLELRSIDWQTPAAMLEKLIKHEAVHEIEGWDDLRRRLAADRRCFGFFHPSLPGEPLIFVEVALVKGLATSIADLVAGDYDQEAAQRNEANADTAIFYSISNCQDGLRGISFGNFLIKQVVAELQSELPHINRFATLSPIPGFARWLKKHLFENRAQVLGKLIKEEEQQAFLEIIGQTESGDAIAAFSQLLESENWWQDDAKVQCLQPPLMRFCAKYLSLPPTSELSPTDPVAGFHLRNGARLEAINWLGNTSPQAIKQSYGLMTNYLYNPRDIETNHEAYVREGIVPQSAAVRGLLDFSPLKWRSRYR